MKPWRHQTNRDGRERSAAQRARFRAIPGVEGLEGRTLLSTAKASVTQPAAYKPPSTKVLFPPYDISVFVTSPTAGTGSNQVFTKDLTIGGIAPAYSNVWLADNLHPGYFLHVTQANGLGQYAFAVPQSVGSSDLQVFSENALQNYSNIEQLKVTRGNSIETWDATALSAIQTAGVSAPEAARDLAVLHAAQYDAVADLTNPASGLLVHLSAPKGASAEASANAAASTVLTALFPSQAATFATDEKSAIAGLPAKPLTTAGENFGEQVANQTLAVRANDGSAASTNPSEPLSQVVTQFAQVTPFMISSGSAFRPASPPASGTATYDQALAEVSALGRLSGSTRTPSQTAAALFWDDDSGSSPVTDPAHWNAIAEQISLSRRDTLVTDARLFAQLDFALADAGIAASDAQVTYQEARPQAAIAPVDTTFVPLLATPASPSYASDHATYASAAAEVLTATFGPKVEFTDSSERTSTLTLGRTFTSFDSAATEDGMSQVEGGVNFSFDVQAGDTLGSKIGSAILAGFPKAK